MSKSEKRYTAHQQHLVEIGAARLVGTTALVSASEISGHTAGTAYEDMAMSELHGVLDGRLYRQHDVINKVLLDSPAALTAAERESLLGPPGQSRLLRRAPSAMEKWSHDNMFTYKQNDTADGVVLPVGAPLSNPTENDRLLLLDVKSHNSERSSQAPNIISSKKLYEAGFEAVAHAKKEKRAFLTFDMLYVFLSWEMQGGAMLCNKSEVISLFKTDPSSLRINWAAGGQIQFHPCDVDQSWNGTSVEWMMTYLGHRNLSRERYVSRSRDECKRDSMMLENLINAD